MTMHKALHPYGYFKRQTGEISHEKTWTGLWKEKLKRETKSVLIATQNNVIRANYIKMPQNSLCWLCGDKNETINNISKIS